MRSDVECWLERATARGSPPRPALSDSFEVARDSSDDPAGKQTPHQPLCCLWRMTVVLAVGFPSAPAILGYLDVPVAVQYSCRIGNAVRREFAAPAHDTHRLCLRGNRAGGTGVRGNCAKSRGASPYGRT